MTNYVVPGVDRKTFMAAVVQISDIAIKDEGDHYLLEIENDPRYSLEKRVNIAQVMGVPPDELSGKPAKTSWVCVDKNSTDPDNTWLFANATSVGNPESVIDLITRQLQLNGLPAECYDEYSPEFEMYMEMPPEEEEEI